MKRSVINILDLSVEELDELIATANDIIAESRKSTAKSAGARSWPPCSSSPPPGPG